VGGSHALTVPPIPTFPHTGGKGSRAGENPHPGQCSSGRFLLSEFQLSCSRLICNGLLPVLGPVWEMFTEQSHAPVT
jgi:hypothetical protein